MDILNSYKYEIISNDNTINNYSLFFEITDNEFLEFIKNIQNININQITSLLNKLCIINNNNLILNYKIFKFISCNETYSLINNYITASIKSILKNSNTVNVHMSMKDLTMNEINKHHSYFYNLIILFKNEFPDKLHVCYVYNTPYIFSNLFSIISCLIDKKTKEKIIIVDNENLTTINNNTITSNNY
jgi:hypothetical protein